MRLLPRDFDFPSIRSRHGRPIGVSQLADRHLGVGVQTEDGLGSRILEHAFFHHQRSAAFFSGRRTFLGRLEDELHGAGKLRAHRGEHRRDAKLNSRVQVVSARVHHADLLTEIHAANLRRERQPSLLGDRERIHVGANRDDRSRTSSLQQRHDAVMRDARLDLEPELPQVVGDERRGLLFTIRQLGVLMNLMANLGRRRNDLGGLLLDSRQWILRGQY
jgi:hypothetical protein